MIQELIPFADAMNIPLKNVINTGFIEKVQVRAYVPFVTRPADEAPGANNTAKGIEVIVPYEGL